MGKARFHLVRDCHVSLAAEGTTQSIPVDMLVGVGMIAILDYEDGELEERKLVRVGSLQIREKNNGKEFCLRMNKTEAYALAAEIAAVLIGDAAVERMEAHFGGQVDG